MKLHISFDFPNLAEALIIAKKTAGFADILEIGTLLLCAEGSRAVAAFRETFPDKDLYADGKICDHADEMTSLLAKQGAHYVSVLAGSSTQTILRATASAHSQNTKIALDLIDAYSMGQSAMDAKNFGVDLIVFHRSHEAGSLDTIVDEWEQTRGNTDLPIFVSGRISRSTIKDALALKPQGLIIGGAITRADDPAAEAAAIKEIMAGRVA